MQPEAEEGTPGLVGSDRVLFLLRQLAEHPAGVSLEDLARKAASPKSTAHRALMTLRRAGFAEQDGRGRYVLGDEFLRLAFAHHEARPDHMRIEGALQALCDAFRETTHYAVLDGRSVVYRSKVDPPAGAFRLTSHVGGRNPAHSTALGKALLAYDLPDDAAVRAWVEQAPLEHRTGRTRVRADQLCEELSRVRAMGYATEDQENEPGISCLAVPVFLVNPNRPSGAVSISALAHRTSLAQLVAALPTVRSLLAQHS